MKFIPEVTNMKKIMILLVCLLWTASAWGDLYLATNADSIFFTRAAYDSGGYQAAVDSIRVVVTQNNTELSDAFYEDGDDEGTTENTDYLRFADAFADLDGATSSGEYEVTFSVYVDDIFIDYGIHVHVGYQDVNVVQISGSSDAADSSEKTVLGTLADYGDYHSDGDTSQVNVAEAGDAMTLTTGERAAIEDTIANHASTYQSDGDTNQVNPAEAGDAMALTAAERTYISDTVWNEILTGGTHNEPTSAGRRLRQLETGQVLLTGTINTANDSTATLDLGGAYDDGFFEHTWLVVTVGEDSVQIRSINDYTGATDSVDMAAGESWVVVPSNGDEWEIVAAAGVHVVDLHQPVLNQISKNVKDSIFFQRVDVGDYATTDPDSFLGRANLNWNNISNAGGVTVDNMENDVITDGAISTAGAQFIGREAWQNIDTTNTIDTSDVGDWLKNNVAGGAAVLPDSVVARIDSILTSLGYDSPDLHTKVDNLSLSGGGTEPETLIVLASADSTQIQGARVIVRTIDQSTIKVDGLTTDVNGKLILDLDADSFFVAVTANNYTQTLDTIVIAGGGQTDTLWMTIFDPGSPANPDLCRLYGTLYDYDGSKLRNTTVRAQIPTKYWPVRWNAKYAFKASGETKTNASGFFQLDLYPSVGILTGRGDSSSVWEIIAADVFHEYIILPDTNKYELIW
jgi:hypothetical protein